MSGREPLQLEVRHLDSEGYGIAAHRATARAKLRTVHVKAALPGERVTARVLKKRRGELFAETQSVQRASGIRRSAPCAHYPRCGGCSLQHLAHERGLRLKQDRLLDALRRQDVSFGALQQPVFGPRLAYRRKARMGVRLLSSGIALGFRESFSARVARLNTCLVLVPELARVLPELRSALCELSIAARVPQVELAAGDRRAQIVLRHLEPPSATDRQVLVALQQRSGAQLLLQPAGPDSVRDLDGASPQPLSYALPEFGLDLQFGALDFTQVNAAMNRRLVSDVVTLVRESASSDETVLDLFCGVGNFSLPLARAGFNVHGLEGSASSVNRARCNARVNRVAAQFATCDLYSQAAVLPQSVARVWVLDPPKSGAGPQLSQWLQSAPHLQRVVYVSCNPVTFASDARVLKAQGFDLQRVGIYDMFPQTSHVETLGVFSKSW